MSMSLQRTPSTSLPQFRGVDEPVAAAPPPSGPTLGPTGDERPFFRLDLMRALQLHRKLALGIALTGAALAAAMAVKMWPIYTAKSQIYIQPIPPQVMEQGNQPRWPYDANTYDSFIQQQVQDASNPEVLISALHKLPAGSFQHSDESDQAAAIRLGETIEVGRIGTSYEVLITARTNDPQLSADVANAVAKSIVERASGEANAGDTQRLAILREERDRIQKELDSDRSEQDALNKQLGMAAVGVTAPDLIDDEIDKTRQELITARTAHDEAEARFNSMGAGQTSSAAIEAQADEMIASDPGLTSMKTSLNQRRAALITQMANLTPNNPEYKQDTEELAQINKSLDSMMNDLRTKAAGRIEQQLRSDLERTAGVEDQLNGQLRQLAGTAASATPKLQRASDLASDIVRLQTRYAAVDEDVHNLMLQDSAPGAVHVSVPAVAPTHPSYSGILKKTFPIGLAGIVFGLLAALIANNFDPKVYIASDVEQVLNVAPMAVLPNFNEVSDEAAAEHVLRIAASMEHACKQGSLKRVIFTGASLGAGATTILARVKELLEAMGRDTMLIDASGAQAPAQRVNQAAEGSAGVQSLVLSQRGSRSSALLQQVAEEDIPQVEDKLVLTDTAPLTISAETAYLARFVDCVMVVIESGETTRTQLREVAQTLQRLNVTAAGFVLNRVSLAKADPAFRQSVAEVERHLRSQNRTNGRRAARSTAPEPETQSYSDPKTSYQPQSAPYAAQKPAYSPAATTYAPPASAPAPVRPSQAISSWEPVSVVGEPYQAKAAETQVAGYRPPSATPVPDRSMESANSWDPVPVSVEPYVAKPPQQPPAPPLNAATTAQTMPAQPTKAAAHAEMPWWLADANPTAKPAPQPPAVREETWGHAPEPTAPPVPAAAGPEEVPARSWERLAARGTAITGAAEQPAVVEENRQTTSTRLSGLRGKFFSFGLKNLKGSREDEELEDDRQPKNASSPDLTGTTHRYVASSGPLQPPIAPARNAVPATAKQVTAEPEFLPPKSLVVTFDKEHERLDENSERRDRRDAFDDLQILPSWRGQYRKRD